MTGLIYHSGIDISNDIKQWLIRKPLFIINGELKKLFNCQENNFCTVILKSLGSKSTRNHLQKKQLIFLAGII